MSFLITFAESLKFLGSDLVKNFLKKNDLYTKCGNSSPQASSHNCHLFEIIENPLSY